MPTYPVTLTTSYGYSENYDALSGTSMATPMVSGIAGLVLSENPTLTAAEVKGLLMAAAGDGASWGPNLAFGIVNASNAVSSAIHPNSGAPGLNLMSPGEGATVSGLVTVQAAPTNNTKVHHVDVIQNDSRLMQPLIGTSTTTGTGKNASTVPAWTALWPSTALWNGSVTASALAVDVFGNTSAL